MISFEDHSSSSSILDIKKCIIIGEVSTGPSHSVAVGPLYLFLYTKIPQTNSSVSSIHSLFWTQSVC